MWIGRVRHWWFGARPRKSMFQTWKRCLAEESSLRAKDQSESWTTELVPKHMYSHKPILPGVWIYPGIMPILHSPGLIIPGQLGPINLVLVCCFKCHLTLWMTEQNVKWINYVVMGAHIARTWCSLLREYIEIHEDQTFAISFWGIPSVMHTTNGISARRPSKMASAAKGGGT